MHAAADAASVLPMFNWYSLFSLAVLPPLIFLWHYVWFNRRNDGTNRLFLILTGTLICNLVISFFYLLIPAITGATVPNPVLAYLYYLTIFVQGPFTLCFILNFTGHPMVGRRRPPFVILCVYAVAMLLFFDRLLSGYSVHAWGLAPVITPFFTAANLVCYILPVMVGVVVLIRKYLTLTDAGDRVRYRLIAWGLFGGLLINTAVIVWAYIIEGSETGHPFAIISTLWFTAFVYRGVSRHNLLVEDRRSISQAFDTLLSNVGEGIVIMNADRTVLRSSRGLEMMLNIHRIGALNGLLTQLLPGYEPTGEYRNCEVVLHAEEGDRTVMFSQFPLAEQGGARHSVIMLFNDVTELHRSRSSLEEKEVLLKEIHHRVKNNLQVISSLLNLQSRHVKDPADRELFAASRQRIRAIALVHEKLYQSDIVSRINCRDYIGRLVGELQAVYVGSGITMENGIDDVLLAIDKAVPCGLIVSELVSNCFKHAFTDGTGGIIRTSVRQGGEGKYILQVADNGRGLPDTGAVGSGDSLGLELVTGLVEQLDGELNVENNNGASFTITFPE